jgi:hypothetical protein
MSAGDWLTLPLVLAGCYVAIGVGIGLTFRKVVRDSMADFLSDDGDAIRAHVRSIGGLNRVAWLTGSTWPSLMFFLVKSIREQRRDAKRGKP